MGASEKEAVLAAVRKKFVTKEVKIGDGVTVTLRELSNGERKALNARIFMADKDGNLITHDAAGNPDPKGTDYKYNHGKDEQYAEEWIAATISPAFTVEELLDPAWPTSLKRMLCDEARKINGITVKEAAGN